MDSKSRYLIASAIGLIILGLYFSITTNIFPPRFSNIQPSNSPCPPDFISQVKCLSKQTLGRANTSTIGKLPLSQQLREEQRANYAYNKGIALAQSGKILEAIKYYDKALAIQPTNSDLLMTKGDALSRIGNYTDAIKYYDMALAIQPNSISSTGIIINKANDLYRLGRYDQAIRSYDKALVVQPNDPDLLINKGHALFHMANYSGAINYYDKALAMLPNNDSSNTSIVINKALSLFKLRDYTDAIKYFDKALSIFPTDVGLRKDRMQAVRAFHNNTNSGTQNNAY